MTVSKLQRATVPCTRKRVAAKNLRGSPLSSPSPSSPTSPHHVEKGPITRSRAKNMMKPNVPLMDLKVELDDILTKSEKESLFFAPIPESENEQFECVTYSDLSSVPKHFFNASVQLDDMLKPYRSTSDMFDCLGDGSSLKIKKCSNSLCLLPLAPHNHACSSVTNRLYKCVVPPGNTKVIDCSATNVVYLITCDSCKMQYVGETGGTIRQRFQQHRMSISAPDKYSYCKYLPKHFSSGLCNGSTYKVQILEKLDGDGRTIINGRNLIDPVATRVRKKRETHWMLKLRTVYPFGLNDRVGDEFATQRNKKLVARQFPKLARTFPRQSKGNGKNSPKLEPGTFLNIIDHLLQTSLPDVMNYIRVTVDSLKKSTLKKIVVLIQDTILADDKNQHFVQWYLAIIDAIESKLLKPTVEKPKKIPESILKIKISQQSC